MQKSVEKDKKASKKAERRKKLAEFIGKQQFAKKAYVERQKKLNKAYSEAFATTLTQMEREAYTSIHKLPIWNWDEIAKTGNVSLLLREQREVTKIEYNALNFIYKQLRNEFIAVFGWEEDKLQEIELMQEIVYRNLVLQATGDYQQLTFIELAEIKLADLQKENKGNSNLVELCVSLEEILKITIDMDKCSVAKFYGYINRAKKKGENG